MIIQRGRDIVQLLRENDRAIGRALVFLNSKQTSDEQSVKQSKHENYKGFRKQDAKRGTEDAEFFLRNGYLTSAQIAYWREKTREGMRISVYWKQLFKEAKRKERARNQGELV